MDASLPHTGGVCLHLRHFYRRGSGICRAGSHRGNANKPASARPKPCAGARVRHHARKAPGTAQHRRNRRRREHPPRRLMRGPISSAHRRPVHPGGRRNRTDPQRRVLRMRSMRAWQRPRVSSLVPLSGNSGNPERSPSVRALQIRARSCCKRIRRLAWSIPCSARRLPVSCTLPLACRFGKSCPGGGNRRGNCAITSSLRKPFRTKLSGSRFGHSRWTGPVQDFGAGSACSPPLGCAIAKGLRLRQNRGSTSSKECKWVSES